MVNKKFVLGILVLLVIGIGLFLYLREREAQIPNPAAVYCEEQGGRLESRILKGGSYGFCIFDDGSECGQWAFFRGECEKGERFCKDLCGDGVCQEVVCMAVDCPCAESAESCPEDCV